MRSFFDQVFLVAEGLKHVEIESFTIEDALNLAFAGDVLDLATAERIAFHYLVVVLNILDFRTHVLPDVHSGVGLGVVKLDFEPEAIEAIAHKAHERKTGARGLRSILEQLMNDLMFTIPSDETIEKCVITKEAVEKTSAPLIVHREQPLKKAE